MSIARSFKKSGFTIVELLTVMGIIAVLIGLLVPALSAVRDYADTIQQKAQFHSIEVGIDLYVAEYEEGYPESNDNSVAPTHPVDPDPYGGAQKLAEALVGQDFLGFHPNSDFRANGEYTHPDNVGGTADPRIYYLTNDYLGSGNPAYAETLEENLQVRGEFIDLENANAFDMVDVYGSTTFNDDSPVLCDVYKKKRIGGKKTGTPILYYKANTMFKFQDSTGNAVYDYDDNAELLNLGSAEDSLVDHPLADGIGDNLEEFDSLLVNPQVTSVDIPYKSKSYILISAGKDGLFGNADDIYNFKKEE